MKWEIVIWWFIYVLSIFPFTYSPAVCTCGHMDKWKYKRKSDVLFPIPHFCYYDCIWWLCNAFKKLSVAAAADVGLRTCWHLEYAGIKCTHPTHPHLKMISHTIEEALILLYSRKERLAYSISTESGISMNSVNISFNIILLLLRWVYSFWNC